MEINIHSRRFALTKALFNYAKQRLNSALARKNERVQKVVMRLSDVNGPRGGSDKRCHLHVKLAGLPDIVIADTETDMYSSIDKACARVSTTINRKVERHQKLLKQSSKFNFKQDNLLTI